MLLAACLPTAGAGTAAAAAAASSSHRWLFRHPRNEMVVGT